MSSLNPVKIGRCNWINSEGLTAWLTGGNVGKLNLGVCDAVNPGGNQRPVALLLIRVCSGPCMQSCKTYHEPFGQEFNFILRLWFCCAVCIAVINEPYHKFTKW